MDINPKINKTPVPENPLIPNQSVAESASILFNLKRKKISIKPAKIKQITKGLAEIAFSLGETNDPEEFAEELTEDIYESMKEAQKRINNTNKKKK